MRNLIISTPLDDDDTLATNPARAEKLGDLYLGIKQHIFVEKQKQAVWKKVIAIAAILLAIATSAAYFLRSKDVLNNKPAIASFDDVKPGKNAATLTLSNGKQIILSDQGIGELANEPGISISKNANGVLVYKIEASGEATEKNNTLTTTQGETYQVILPDNSKVWLNAASSLTYAASLGSRYQTRTVKLSGEAYFEVAHDKTRPFIVKTTQQEVKVLGTHFNVNSYGDNGQTITSLAEGSVQVQPALHSLFAKILKPGQKSVLGKSAINIAAANLETDLAWKNGLFTFDEATVPEVMQQISRWYNIDVRYNTAIPNERISGGISRQSDLKMVLKMLELIKINYKIENNEKGRKTLVIL
ncbi:FecR family protein [Flavobacterium cerinum]|uniref:FecR domain-containing protein n=1 Tax=Flavobacterium cerinum TaxID=2502784 RepID=A0ABY5IN18_9FLAO|nr:FecR domain-containing protein [Flavobacterium cerinum]UUC44185.1 FecR domain-containing protein [Flavobacterium cerinum]